MPRESSQQDPYVGTASAYDLLNASGRPEQVAAMRALLPLLQPEYGPVLDIGAGSGMNSALVLEEVPEATVFALEPSPAMRALAMGRLAQEAAWSTRVTLWPYDYFSAPLPETIAGAVMMGSLGHFDESERRAVFMDLAGRLPAGGAVLVDLPEPTRPQRVEAEVVSTAQLGELTYRTMVEGWPDGEDAMRWRMTYLTHHGQDVILETTSEHVFRHPDPDDVASEARAAGLEMEQVGQTTYWLLVKADEREAQVA